MDQVLFPSFRYRDADGAIRWMVEVLGGRLLQRMDGGADGAQVAHAEVEIAGGVVLLGSWRNGGEAERAAGTTMVYVVVDDPDGWHARAVERGAEVLMGLVDTDYGSRDFALVDPEGNHWYFGTYRPERRPSEAATQELS